MTTKLAIIADIHGNLPALEAVMADLKQQTPDQVLINGDLVGRGPQSREVLDTIAGHDWPVIQGNHEAFWVDCDQGKTPDDWMDNGWWGPIQWGMDSLNRTWFDWMTALPTEYIIDIPGAPQIQLVHGSPRRLNEGLYTHDPDAVVLDALGGTPYPIVIGAHTHIPMDRHVPPYWVLNTGSVGAPFNGDIAAQYLMLTWNGQMWEAARRRVEYDRAPLLQYWHDSGYWDTGVAAQVFAHEVETATFHFWHYVRYCKAHALPLNDAANFQRYLKEAPTPVH